MCMTCAQNYVKRSFSCVRCDGVVNEQRAASAALVILWFTMLLFFFLTCLCCYTHKYKNSSNQGGDSNITFQSLLDLYCCRRHSNTRKSAGDKSRSPFERETLIRAPKYIHKPQTVSPRGCKPNTQRDADGDARKRVRIRRDPEESIKRMAICIAIDFYNEDEMGGKYFELSGCVNDAKAVKKTLLEQHHYRNKNIKMFLNDKAKSVNIMKYFKELKERLREDSHLII